MVVAANVVLLDAGPLGLVSNPKLSRSDKNIDADMILIGQALSLGVADFLIAKTNIGHLARFVRAELWSAIVPTTSA
jgi:hypothetical protein